MKSIFLLSVISEDDVVSIAFLSKKNAIEYIGNMYPGYKKKAESTTDDIEYWHKTSNSEGIVLEKLIVGDTNE